MSLGIGHCTVIAHVTTSDCNDADDVEKHNSDLDRHSAACPLCLARSRFVQERLPPLLPLPLPVAIKALVLFARIPKWLRPALAGAAVLFGIVFVRLVAAAPFAVPQPRELVEAMRVLLAAAAAGASGGLVYSAARPALRRFGNVGDYLTGIVCMAAYLSSLAAIAPYAFGEPIFDVSNQ